LSGQHYWSIAFIVLVQLNYAIAPRAPAAIRGLASKFRTPTVKADNAHFGISLPVTELPFAAYLTSTQPSQFEKLNQVWPLFEPQKRDYYRPMVTP